MPAPHLTHAEFLNYARRVIFGVYESRQDFALKNGISPAYVSDILRGKRMPGDKFLSALGVQREFVYTNVCDEGDRQ